MDFYLLVIALALQLQTILGEQLASDDQAADVQLVSRRLRPGMDLAVAASWSTEPQIACDDVSKAIYLAGVLTWSWLATA